MKTLITLAIVGLVGATQADTIYSATAANSTVLLNTVGSSSIVDSSSGTGITYTGSGHPNMGGFNSNSTIEELLGTALTDDQTVIISTTIASMTGDLEGNGFEFGMSTAKSFRPDGNLLLGVRDGDDPTEIATNAFVDPGGDAGFGVTEASLLDGFGITLTANKDGYTFALSDVILSYGTVAAYSGSFEADNFVDNFGGGYFYAAAQSITSVEYSSATIDVIPEPATLGLVATFGGAVLFIRRRLLV